MNKKFQTTIQVRPSDIDLNMHIHFTKYLEYALMARYDQLKKDYNYSIEKFFKEGYSWLVKKLNVNYLYPGYLMETIVVTTWINSMQGIDLNIGVEINARKKLFEGELIFGLVDVKAGKPIEIPEAMIEYFKQFKE